MPFSLAKLNNRSYILLLASVALLTYLSLYFLFSPFKPDTTTIWKLVPNEAIAVLEIHKPSEFRLSLAEKPAWQELSVLPYLSEAEELLHLVDSLKMQHQLLANIGNHPIWTSIHATSRNELGFMFYIPMQQPPIATDSLLRKLALSDQFHYATRAYHDQLIEELEDIGTGTQLTFFFYENYLIGSTTAWLIEDIIRQEQESSFFQRDWKRIKETFERKTVPNLAAHLYLNHKQLPLLVKTLWATPFKDDANWLKELSDGTVWGLTIDELSFSLSGKTAHKMHNEPRLANLFEQQAAQASDLAAIVPAETAYLYRLAFADATTFLKKTYAFQRVEEDFIQEVWDSYSFDVEDLWEQVNGEIALAVLPPQLSYSEQEQLLFVQLKDTTEVAAQLRSLMTDSKNIAQDFADATIFSHHFIGQLPVESFPNYVFGDFYEGFSHCYFTFIDHYLVLANAKNTLIHLFESMANKEVWAAQSKYHDFAPLFSEQANIGLAINFEHSWKLTKNPLAETWKKAFTMNRRHLGKIGTAFLSFNLITDESQGKITLRDIRQLEEEAKEDAIAFRFAMPYSKALPVAAKTHPTWVFNHQDSSSELFFQDRWNRVNLISKSGKRLWTLGMGKPLASPVQQIDFFANHNLQYAFAVGNQIKVYDRLARPVNGFPLTCPTPIQTVSILDYNQQGQYFFAVSDQYGQIYMFNKFGRLRFGWQPKRLSNELARPVQHIKIANEDFVVAIQKDGVLFAWDKYANTVSGFPVSLHEQIGNISLHQGDSLSAAHIKVLSTGGLLFKINFLGKVIERSQLIKSQDVALFTQCNDENGSSNMVYARQEGKSVAIFQANGKLNFSTSFKNDYDKQVQYFYFNDDIQLIAISNKRTHQTYLYYISGEPVESGVFDSDQTVSMHYDRHSQSYYLYKCYGKRVEAIKLEL